MNNEIDQSILKLDQHRNLTLRQANGGCIHVHWGRVWVTRNGDIEDHVVSGGESLAIDRPGATVLTAMSDAGVSLMKRCLQTAAAPGTVMQQGDSAVSGAISRADSSVRDAPQLSEIERRVDRAHRLRARYFGDALGKGLAALRGGLTGWS
jgi:hypothetical protein